MAPELRHELTPRLKRQPESTPNPEHPPCCCHAHDLAAPENPATAIPHHANTVRLTLTAMDCPTEAALIRKAFAHMPEVLLLEFDLINRILSVTHTFGQPMPIYTTLLDIGMLAQSDIPSDSQSPSQSNGLPDHLTGNFVATNESLPQAPSTAMAALAKRKAAFILCMSGLFALGAEAISWMQFSTTLEPLLALCAIALAGRSTLQKGWLALRHLNLNIHLLMSVAVIGAMLLGEWPEAAMVVFLFALAEKIEAASLDRVRHAIAALQAQAPETALLVHANGSVTEIASGQLLTGQTVRARPGDRIAVDGVVRRGRSSVNQAPITGESMPIEKTQGDCVFAGTLNQDGMLEYSVTAAAGHTTLDRIARAIAQARQQRAPMERKIDQFARLYTPFILALALLLALVPPLLSMTAWMETPHSWHDSLYMALILLVIACPCALVIATPVTVVSALTNAARRGLLIKGGHYLEQAHQLCSIAFDKTGTLTTGVPELHQIITLDNMSETACLHLAASLNALSQHPIAVAMTAALHALNQKDIGNANRITYPILPVDHFTSAPGSGVIGEIQGVRYMLGNPDMMNASGPVLDSVLNDRIEQLQTAGATVVVLCKMAVPCRVMALFALADTVRPESAAVIRRLQDMGMTCVMLTGDNRYAANAIARQVGIAEVHADLLPDDKLSLVELLRQRGQVAMVGDGVNDAPALARADIGITLGAAASATALETADIALMQDGLNKLPELILLSRHCTRIVWQNIAIALGIKLLFFGLTLSGHANLWMAVFADMGASLCVILNGLRLLRNRA